MKANELMIGDWVKFPTSDLCHKVYAVQGKSVKFDNKYWYKADKLEPVPLTAEILDKNCADNVRERKYVGREWTWYNDDMDYIEVSTHAGGFDCRDGFFVSANDGEYYLFVIRYVHELQHALRLCGIEKEIVL